MPNPCRKRSYSEDYAAAVRALVAADVPAADSSNDKGEGTTAAAAKDGAADVSEAEEGGEEEEESSEAAASFEPGKHPLQPVLASLGGAMAEINQLINLIDLGKTGEFVRIERVAEPFAESGPGPLVAAAAAQGRCLKAAAESLAAHAAQIRGTVAEQRRHQRELAALRRRWRIVAPAHGKVSLPLRVGEPLAVDCSYASAGGIAGGSSSGNGGSGDVVSGGVEWMTAGASAAGGWRVILRPDADGSLSCVIGEKDSLKTLQVVVAYIGPDGNAVVESVSTEASAGASGSAAVAGPVAGAAAGGVDNAVEQRLRRVRHSAFCEELLAAVKIEAQSTCPQWIGVVGMAPVTVAEAGSASKEASLGAGLGDAAAALAARRRKFDSAVSSGTRQDNHATAVSHVLAAAAPSAAGNATVVHVLDEEVCVQISDQHTVTFRLVDAPAFSGSARPTGSAEASFVLDAAGVARAAAVAADANGGSAAVGDDTQRAELRLLCRLVLLHSNCLLREGQRVRAASAAAAAAAAAVAREKERTALALMSGPHAARMAAKMAAEGERPTKVPAAAAVTLPPVLMPVVAVLRHHVFRADVCRVVAEVAAAAAVPGLGVPITAEWSLFALQSAESRLVLRLGHGVPLTLQLSQAAATVEAAPGLTGTGTYRRIPLHDALELRQWLLSEVCRQLALACGDLCVAMQTRLAAAAAKEDGRNDGDGGDGSSSGDSALGYGEWAGAELRYQVSTWGEGGGGNISVHRSDAPGAAYTVSFGVTAAGGSDIGYHFDVACCASGNDFIAALQRCSIILRQEAASGGGAATTAGLEVAVMWGSILGKDVFERFVELLHVLVRLPPRT
ncbi:unnamed protein product [Phaeothamnion confervicola]